MRIFLYILASLFIVNITISAQSTQFDPQKPIPIDSFIHKGKLPNGITYYYRQNTKPEKRIELRLAVNAGSVLEDDDQLGLAHFTEHMAFNGTKHFPKNELVSYLQSIGVRFGADINAYTSFDETVYMLFMPSDKPEIVKTGFEVLSDWAHELSFDSLEIEKERGVIIEEWRLGRGAEQRMRDNYYPYIFYNSQYAKRLPIGTKESLETFKPASLRRFYKDWYRPDQMAVVVVGDINFDEAKKLIEQNFADIPSSTAPPRVRKTIEVPGHDQTFISINKDKEAAAINIHMFYKTNHQEDRTIGDFRPYYTRQLYFMMFNQRLDELTRSANPPFINAESYFGGFGARSKDAYINMAMVGDTGIMSGIKSINTENEKAKRFGFTASELERAKAELLNGYEEMYKERDKTESDNIADEYVRNFLDKEPIPGITFEYEYFKYLASEITLDEVNQLAKQWIINNNRVLVITAPDKESVKLPTESQVRELINTIESSNIEAYKDNMTTTQLMSEKPKAGKVVKQENDKKLNIKTLTLSNGVEVMLKPTNFKNDEILMKAFSPGGQFLYPDNEHFSASYATAIIGESGVSNFSAIDLQKLLSGKSVSASPYINSYTEGFNGSCAPKDFETMLQLVYLYFTNPRVDTLAFNSFTNRYKSYLQNVIANPQVYYSDQLRRTLSNNHPRGASVPQPADIDKIKLNEVFQIYRDRFADASDFKFVLVGNFNTDSIIPFIEQYLGALPSINRQEKWHDVGIRAPKGMVDKKVRKGSDPKSMVTLVFTDSVKYDQKEAYYLKSLADLMNIRLVEVLREEKSGVYGVGASASMSRLPYGSYSISIRFPCAPTNVDSLVSAAFSIIADVQTNGISDINLNKVKETQEREFEVGEKTNSFWLSYLENSWFYNDDINEVLKTKESIKKLKSSDIQNVAKKYFKKDYIKVVLYPEKM